MHAFLALFLLAQIPNPQTQYGVVTGVLRTAAGKPAVSVRVTAMVPPDSPTDIASSTAMASVTQTDADGRYRLENIPPGRYYITAGRVDFPTYYPGAIDVAGGVLILVPTGGIVPGVDFVLRDQSVGRAPASIGSGSLSYTIPVKIQMEDGGKVPIYQQGSYPLLRFIEATTNMAVEIGFGETKAVVPFPQNPNGDEYRVFVANLQDGYTVKSITHGSADLQKETLKIPKVATTLTRTVTIGGQLLTMSQSTGPLATTSSATLTVVLTRAPAVPQPGNGKRVTGSGTLPGDEIYISNVPGILYSDGTFEFRDVPPGLHNIVKTIGSVVTAAPVLVGGQNVDGVELQRLSILPADIFSDPPKPNGTIPDSRTLPLMSIAGRVLDEISQEAVNEGAVTIAGYGVTRRVYAITSDGQFDIPDLLPGSYSITLNISGYTNSTHPVTVGAEDLKLDLTGRREPR